ncbi:cytochrome P450 [Streptomyces sp. NPDC005423]|uniref:cytochrome P450 n=1 Tax=Streptomyces sp. NPDC005423 TaxID=3155343 RepID=UPI0033A0D72F
MLISEAARFLASSEGRRNPYPAYAALRAHGPVVRLGANFYAATGYDAINALLRDPRLRVMGWPEGPASRLIADSLLKANGAEHIRVRRLTAVAFSPGRVEALREAITVEATKLAAYLACLGGSGEVVDFMDEFAYPLPIRVICALLGLPAAEQQWLRERAHELTEVLEPRPPGEHTAAADRAAIELESYFNDLVRRRRGMRGDDLTGALIATHDAGGGLSTRELSSNLVSLLLAGFETTANLIGNGMGVLLDHRGLASRLAADSGLADAYVEELLRLESPLQLTSRWATEEVDIEGADRIEANSHVMVFLGAGNRDPGRFPDPDRFDPFRRSVQPLSFGAGAHYCLGAALARLEARVAFPLLLARFPAMVRGGEAVRRDRSTFRGYANLPIFTGS